MLSISLVSFGSLDEARPEVSAVVFSVELKGIRVPILVVLVLVAASTAFDCGWGGPSTAELRITSVGCLFDLQSTIMNVTAASQHVETRITSLTWSPVYEDMPNAPAVPNDWMNLNIAKAAAGLSEYMVARKAIIWVWKHESPKPAQTAVSCLLGKLWRSGWEKYLRKQHREWLQLKMVFENRILHMWALLKLRLAE